jgi:hypothetical protein
MVLGGGGCAEDDAEAAPAATPDAAEAFLAIVRHEAADVQRRHLFEE